MDCFPHVTWSTAVGAFRGIGDTLKLRTNVSSIIDGKLRYLTRISAFTVSSGKDCSKREVMPSSTWSLFVGIPHHKSDHRRNVYGPCLEIDNSVPSLDFPRKVPALVSLYAINLQPATACEGTDMRRLNEVTHSWLFGSSSLVVSTPRHTLILSPPPKNFLESFES